MVADSRDTPNMGKSQAVLAALVHRLTQARAQVFLKQSGARNTFLGRGNVTRQIPRQDS